MKVTIIITAQDDRGYLDQAIKSAICQTFPRTEYEIILCSDGNQSLRNYAVKYGIRFTYQEKKGLAANINQGIREAKGEYIKQLGDDDMLAPNCLSALVNAIEKEQADFAHAQAEIWKGKRGQKSIHTPRVTHPMFADLMRRNHIHGGTTMYKKSVLGIVGNYNEKLWTGEELDLHFNLLSHGFKIAYAPTVVMIYRRHNKQKSAHKNPRYWKQRVLAIKRIKRKYRLFLRRKK